MMKPGLERSFWEAIERDRMIVPGDRVCAAVSGGADSVALLRLLDAVRAKLGITLVVAHFDHKLRAESSGDARFVAELARSRGLAFIGAEADVAGEAARSKSNVEETARELRYDFFSSVVKNKRATRVAVAHTMDDQAETVLARMLRGAGPSGLAAIRAGMGSVVRPLLGFRRTALREYLRAIGQEWREDPSNRDTTRQRANIRENLLPLLERDFSPRAVEHLANLARLSAEEAVFWDALAQDRCEALCTRDGKTVSISVAKLIRPLALKPATEQTAVRSLTERLVRRLYQGVRGDLLELGALHVEQVIRLAAEGRNGKRLELPGNILVTRNSGELKFARVEDAETAQKARGRSANETQKGRRAYQYQIQLSADRPTDVSVPELGACFRLKVIDWHSAERETRMWQSLLDLDRLRAPLVLRNWQPGDGYRPRGRRKARKLKEMFLASHVAVAERGRWPVIESCGRVVWAKGMEPAEDFCTTEETRAGVLIEERKL